MLRRTAGRLAAAADLLRPRTLFRTLSRVDSLADRTRELTDAVETLRIQTDQLLTIQRVDWDKRFELARMEKWFAADRIEAHINAAFDRTPLELDPYPHIDRKSTRLNSSHLGISYAVFCLKKTNTWTLRHPTAV